MEALGINGNLLIAQLVNFIVMIVILNALLYKRVLDMLNKRTERIEQSMKDADEVKKRLAEAQKDYEAELAKAKQEASKILSQAQERAKQQESEIIAQARQESERIRADAHEQASRERDHVIGEVKNQLAELVVLTASQVLQAELSSKHDRLIEESLKEFGRQN